MLGAYGASTSEVVNSTLFGKVNGVNWNMLNYYQGQVSDAKLRHAVKRSRGGGDG
jgi:hypothetical protein